MAELSDAEMLLWRRFLRAHYHLIRLLDGDLRDAHGMTISEYDVLLQLSMAKSRRLRMRDLANATLFSPSGLTRLCERLEARGLVTREPAADDQRGTIAVLTATGGKRLRAAAPTHLRGIRERFISRVPDDEVQGLSEALKAIAGDPGDVAESASHAVRGVGWK
ncbi:MAG: MarR family winged helix-turn-helix transcriptional regulator [Actinomycetota bacterium]|nr:MarR family winged helix-turn-helix transcriptional regulator [Actinomycetota bacterium]